jgi:hypothetical protein
MSQCEISGSHSGEYEDNYLLECCAVRSGRSLQTFLRYLLRFIIRAC